MPESRSCRVRRPSGSSRAVPARALDDLRFIRETMERSASFTAASGWGQVVMGFTALAAAFIAARQTSPAAWIQTWLVEAVLAVAIAAAALQAKARRSGLPMTSGPGRKFAFSFVPPIAAGAVLTPILYQAGLTRLLPGAWLLLYGVGVVTGGAFSVSSVPVMGAAFMALGSMVLLLPAAWPGLASPNLAMAAGFGVLHIVFGILIARKHGG